MEFNKVRLIELYEQEQSKTLAAKAYCDELGILYDETFRKKANAIIIKEERSRDPDLDIVTSTETNQYEKSINLAAMPSAWSSEKNRFYTIEEYCDTYGLDKNSVKSSKLVSHNASHMVYNIAFFTDEEEAILDIENNFEKIVQKYIKPITLDKSKNNFSESVFFDRLVYSDVHIAMDVQGKDGDPLYDGKWDKEEILKRLDVMINHAIVYRRSNTLVIDDLGDFMDGLGGQTTRKGHELPQNMNDLEAFDLALEFKIKLIDSLVGIYDTIICNNITNDNHSGAFSYFVSSSTKSILEQRYPGIVTVNSIKRFMDHYSVGKHTFILCHGKDGGEMKFGLKPKLDAVQAEKIDQYCKEHKLYNGNFIEFSKGDSHQAIYDDTTSNDFHYYNYPAFSPPSNWVKTNFGKSKSGFRFYNISKDENIRITIPYWFNS
jgi:hypothetical protein